MQCAVLIPTYNEKENIQKFLQTVHDATKKDRSNQYEIFVIDDHSPDGTAGIVSTFSKRHPSVHLVNGNNEGLGSAMIVGYKHVLRQKKFDVVVSIDADFVVDPRYIPMMVQKIAKGYDVVYASRHGDKNLMKDWTFLRRLSHWTANELFAKTVAGISSINDFNACFRALRVKGILSRVEWKRFQSKGNVFFLQLLLELSKSTNKFYEMRMEFRARTAGYSKVSLNARFVRDMREYIVLCVHQRLQKYSLDFL